MKNFRVIRGNSYSQRSAGVSPAKKSVIRLLTFCFVSLHNQFLVCRAVVGRNSDDVGASGQRGDVEGGADAVDAAGEYAASVERVDLHIADAERGGHRHRLAGRVGHQVGVAVGDGLDAVGVVTTAGCVTWHIEHYAVAPVVEMRAVAFCAYTRHIPLFGDSSKLFCC